MATELPILACTLDAEGAREQCRRYRDLATHVAAVHRRDQQLLIDLDADAAVALVEELVQTERACCPFFTIGWDAGEGRLTFAVSSSEHEPALGVIAEALRA
jgi:hypothetical protein